MPSKLGQLAGIIRYEMRLQWRRRVLTIIAVGFTSLLLIALMQQRLVITSQGISMDQITQESSTFAVVMSLSSIGLMVMMIGLPPVLAETVPKDKQYGVNELLESLPLSSGVYLLGKLLSVWFSVLCMIITISIFEWVASLVLLGPVDLSAYLEIWLLGIGPLALFVSGMSVLLASWQPTRRRATMVGAAFTLYCIVMLPLFSTIGHSWKDAFNPGAWLLVVLRLLFQQLEEGLASTDVANVFPVVSLAFVWRTIMAAVVQLVLVWSIVWLWGRRKRDAA